MGWHQHCILTHSEKNLKLMGSAAKYFNRIAIQFVEFLLYLPLTHIWTLLSEAVRHVQMNCECNHTFNKADHKHKPSCTIVWCSCLPDPLFIHNKHGLTNPPNNVWVGQLWTMVNDGESRPGGAANTMDWMGQMAVIRVATFRDESNYIFRNELKLVQWQGRTMWGN